MFCKKCGKRLPDGTHYCSRCGISLTTPAAAGKAAVHVTTRGMIPVITVLVIAFVMVLTPLFRLYTVDYISERAEFSPVDIYRTAGQIKELAEERGKAVTAEKVMKDDGMLKMMVVMMITVGILYAAGFGSLTVSSVLLTVRGSGLGFWRAVRTAIRLCFWGNMLLFLCLMAVDRYIISGESRIEMSDVLWVRTGFYILQALGVTGAVISDIQTLRLRKAADSQKMKHNARAAHITSRLF